MEKSVNFLQWPLPYIDTPCRSSQSRGDDTRPTFRGELMQHIAKSIEVGAPLRAVYNQWTQFEEFPRFMTGVKEVRQIDDTHVHWHAEIWGKEMEWDAEITEQEPDHRISWMSLEGAWNAGTVRFEPAEDDKTRVRLVMAYQPEGAVEVAGDVLKFLERRVQTTLEDFKKLMEQPGHESGGWRKEVDRGKVVTTPGPATGTLRVERGSLD
jgi:uncharacterized membrane protein